MSISNVVGTFPMIGQKGYYELEPNGGSVESEKMMSQAPPPPQVRLKSDRLENPIGSIKVQPL